MLEQHLYTNEKLREIESGRIVHPRAVTPAGKPALAPLARPLGRAMHRIGHRLESWATSAAESEAPEIRLRGGA